AMLAIDAIEGVPMLPEFDAVIIDEAHELAARVTQASTDELDPGLIERAARRARSYLDDGGTADDLSDAADALADALTHVQPGRIDAIEPGLAGALALVRDSARACFSNFTKEKGEEADPGRQQARSTIDDVRLVAE